MSKTKRSTKKSEKISSELIDSILKGIAEKKGENIVSINLKTIENAVCDYFVICNGTSNVHVKAIADSIEEFVFKATREKPWHIEGRENAEWILLDYVNIVAHVFQKNERKFYHLEELWADAEISEIREEDILEIVKLK